MGRNRYDICTKEIYTRKQIEDIITTQCQKKQYPVPNYYSNGSRVCDFAHDLGIERAGKDGHSYTYHGTDVIKIIDKALEKQAKKKGEPKPKTKTSPSTKPMAKPSQISIDDLPPENNLETLRYKLKEAVSKLIECLTLINSMLEE